jgi:hypothetical protein
LLEWADVASDEQASFAILVQCFDTTVLSPVRAGAHKKIEIERTDLPVWSKSTMSYR